MSIDPKAQAVTLDLQHKIAQTDLFITDNRLKLEQILQTQVDTRLKHQQVRYAPLLMASGFMGAGAAIFGAALAYLKFIGL